MLTERERKVVKSLETMQKQFEELAANNMSGKGFYEGAAAGLEIAVKAIKDEKANNYKY